ncbi:ATP-binding protein [Sagittula sp. NFXS13]|uniref:ATP-binding protein n=1 Tax=Sagittula sp. NFXS13 TaxID=2819095 RepID=UPI0032DFBB73
MTQGNLAPLRNVAALLELVDQLLHRSVTLPGIGVFYGAHGAGKSTATTFAANEYDACIVQAKSYWTRQHMADVLLEELEIKGVRGTLPRKIEAICEVLAASNRPLIFDDAQYMMKSQMIDMARDIFEGSLSPIVFVGEPDFEANLTRWPNIHDRVLVSSETIACNAADAEFLAQIYCSGIEIQPEVIRELVDLTGGSARKLSTDFERIREAARRASLRSVDLSFLPRVGKLHTTGGQIVLTAQLLDKRGVA